MPPLGAAPPRAGGSAFHLWRKQLTPLGGRPSDQQAFQLPEAPHSLHPPSPHPAAPLSFCEPNSLPVLKLGGKGLKGGSPEPEGAEEEAQGSRDVMAQS